MPTYEYMCEKCNHRFEVFQSITASPLTHCPKCGGRVKRLIGAGSAIIFKGSGFYKTDYRSDSYKKRAESDKPREPEKKKSGAESAKPKDK